MAAARDARLQLTTEPTLDPDLPICDPHHHLWDRPDDRYLLDELLQDICSGHNIVSTVFVECGAMYRKDGPPEMKPIGETEFVHGIAAQSASGQYGPTTVAAGIVGHADLTLGAAVTKVLEAHLAASPNRFRGIRHICTWDASPAVKTPIPGAPRGLMLDSAFRAGFAALQKYGLSYDAWLYYPQLPELVSLARAFPKVPIIVNHIAGWGN
jgi:predicted TIM-barrel fold metal-dependent hydrolase